MHELLGQFWSGRLVCGVTGQTIGSAERLSLVRFDERLVLYIMACRAQRERVRGQMKIEFRISRRPCLVYYVTGVAPHIERTMPAPICRGVRLDAMASEAKVLGLVA